MNLLDFPLKKSAVLTPYEYMRLYDRHPESIESASFIIPRIGVDNHFGLFKVDYAPEHYKTKNQE